jgi:hypothetical protein
LVQAISHLGDGPSAAGAILLKGLPLSLPQPNGGYCRRQRHHYSRPPVQSVHQLGVFSCCPRSGTPAASA